MHAYDRQSTQDSTATHWGEVMTLLTLEPSPSLFLPPHFAILLSLEDSTLRLCSALALFLIGKKTRQTNLLFEENKQLQRQARMILFRCYMTEDELPCYALPLVHDMVQEPLT